MWPFLGSLMSGGSSLIGSIFSSDTAAKNTQQQIAAQEQMQLQSEQFNAQQAQAGRDFSALMSNTAYQRSSADMRAAGLNPMMMFGSGGAASTPGASVASVGTPSVPVSQSRGALSGIGEAVNSGLNAMIQGKLVDKMSEEIANIGADRAKTEATTQLVKGAVKIQDPEVRQALIRMGYPDWLASGLTYGHDVSKAIGEGGDAVWSMVPGGKFLRSVIGGGTAKSESADAPAFSPTQNRRIYDIMEQSRGSSARSMSGVGRPSKEMINEWFRKGGTQDQLGGRNPGTGGSYD